jgi:uncharacterized protein Usg
MKPSMKPLVTPTLETPLKTPTNPGGVVDREFRRQLEGYGLTTASILYRMPDHPSFLQEFVWQEYDLFPHFPVLHRFVDFWKKEIEGALHSIRVAHNRLITPAEIRALGAEFRLN